MGKHINKIFRYIIENDFASIVIIVFYTLMFYTIYLPDKGEGGVAYPTTFVGVLLFMLFIFRMFNSLCHDLIYKISKLVCNLTIIGLLYILVTFCLMAYWNQLHSIIAIYILMTLLIKRMFSIKINSIKTKSTIEYIGTWVNKSLDKYKIAFVFCLYILYIIFLYRQEKANIVQQSTLYLLPFVYIFAIKYMVRFKLLKDINNIIIGLHYSLLLAATTTAILSKLYFYQLCYNSYEWIARYNPDTMVTFILIFSTLLICLFKNPSQRKN